MENIKIKVLHPYTDNQLGKKLKKNYIYCVSLERYKEIVKKLPNNIKLLEIIKGGER